MAWLGNEEWIEVLKHLKRDELDVLELVNHRVNRLITANQKILALMPPSYLFIHYLSLALSEEKEMCDPTEHVCHRKDVIQTYSLQAPIFQKPPTAERLALDRFELKQAINWSQAMPPYQSMLIQYTNSENAIGQKMVKLKEQQPDLINDHLTYLHFRSELFTTWLKTNKSGDQEERKKKPLIARKLHGHIVLNDADLEGMTTTLRKATRNQCLMDIGLLYVLITAPLIAAVSTTLQNNSLGTSRQRLTLQECSLLLEEGQQALLNLLDNVLRINCFELLSCHGLSSSRFLALLLSTKAVRLASNVYFELDRVYSSAEFSSDEVVLDFMFGSAAAPNRTRERFTVDWWQPSKGFLQNVIKRFFQSEGQLQSSFPITTIRLPDLLRDSISPILSSQQALLDAVPERVKSNVRFKFEELYRDESRRKINKGTHHSRGHVNYGYEDDNPKWCLKTKYLFSWMGQTLLITIVICTPNNIQDGYCAHDERYLLANEIRLKLSNIKH